MKYETRIKIHMAIDVILSWWTRFIALIPFVPWLQKDSFLGYLREQQHMTMCEDCQSRLEEMIGWYCVDLKPWMNYRTVRTQLHEVWGPVHVED